MADGPTLVFRNPAVYIACLGMALLLTGCVSLQVQKTRQGAAVAATEMEFLPGQSSLQDVLARCGAPDDIVDMGPEFALHYRHTLQRGANLSVGLPLKYVWLPDPTLETRGNLLRYDLAVLVFTPEGVLKDLRYERGTERPMVPDYW